MAEDNFNEYIDDEIDEGQQQLYEHFRFEVDPGQVATRVDKFTVSYTHLTLPTILLV